MAGRTYGHSISAAACSVFATQPTYAFDLGGRYRTLTGVIGQDDGSESREAVLRIALSGDGRLLASRRVGYGQTAPVSVPVAGVRRLTVSYTEVSCGTGGAASAFGSARLR